MAAKGGERVTYDNGYILIGQSKQCARMREPRGVLKIKIYAQRLTHRVCMGDGGSAIHRIEDMMSGRGNYRPLSMPLLSFWTPFSV